MYAIRKSMERGFVDHGFATARLSFSWGPYKDERFDAFGPLCGLHANDIHPGKGFEKHPHRELEILALVLDGTLHHQDTLGNDLRVPADCVLYTRSASGIEHREFNASDVQSLRFLNIWLRSPASRAMAPRVQQVRDLFQLPSLHLAGRDAGALIPLVADVEVFVHRLVPHAAVTLAEKSGRRLWLHVIDGNVIAGDQCLEPGDALYGPREETTLRCLSGEARLILFDTEVERAPPERDLTPAEAASRGVD